MFRLGELDIATQDGASAEEGGDAVGDSGLPVSVVTEIDSHNAERFAFDATIATIQHSLLTVRGRRRGDGCTSPCTTHPSHSVFPDDS